MKRMLGAVIKKYFKLLVSISLVASLGFGLISGLTSGYQTLKRSLESYVEKYAYPDIHINTEVTSVSKADELLKIDGVKAVDSRLCADTIMKDKDGEFYSVRVFTYSDETIEKFNLRAKIGDDREGVLLEYKFAKNNGLSAGDTIHLFVREAYRPYTVTGIVSRPETMSAKISDNAWGLNYDFGYIYAPVEFLTREYEMDKRSNKGELDKKSVDLSDEKESAENLISDKKQELENAKSLLSEKKAEYNASQQEAQDTASTLRSTRAELVASKQELEGKKGTLNSTAATLQQTKADLQSKYSKLSEARSALNQIDSGLSELQTTKSRLQSPSVVNVVGQLSAMPANTPMYSGASHVEVPSVTDEEEQVISENVQNADASNIDYSALEAALVGYSGVSVSGLTTGQAVSVYYSAVSDVDSQISTLSSQRASVVSELRANGVDEGSIDSSMSAAQEGIRECDRSQAQLESTRVELNNGIKEINDAISQIDSTLSEIESKLSEGQSQLDAAEKEILEGDAKLKDASKQLKEFADLDEELVKAYKKLDEGEGYDKLCNQFMLYLDDGADQDEILEKAKEVLKDIKLKSSYTFADSPVKNRIDMNLDPMGTLMLFLPAIFFAITLIVIFLFMSMIIHQSRREISILRALGFSKAAIRFLFCKVSVIVALVGIVLGSGIGYGLRWYAGDYFEELLALPEIVYDINYTGVIAGAAATIAVCIAATLFSTVMVSRVSPKEAMSRPIQSNVKVNAVTEKLLQKSSPMFKLGVVSMLRNKGRFFFSTICIAASVAVIFASFSFTASKNLVIEQTFEDRIRYDCQIFFEEAPTPELLADIENVNGVSKAEDMLLYNAKVSSGGHSKKVVIHAVNPDNDMIALGDGSDGSLPVKDGSIILESHAADTLGVTEGDRIQVKGVSMDVSKVIHQCANRMQYITMADAKNLGKPDLGCVTCTFDGNARKELLAFLTKTEGYLYCVFTEAFFNDNKELYATYDFATWILIGFAMLVGFVIVLNTSMTDLQDNKRELCVLRTLGFRHGEISSSRFFRSLLQFIIAFIIGIGPGILLAKFTLVRLSTPDEGFLFASGLFEWVITAVPVFLYMLISHFISMRSMKKWNAAEVVKERE